MSWTKEQTQTLNKLWPSREYNVPMIAKQVGKGVGATAIKARLLKLGRKPLRMPGSPNWPAEKIAKLRELWPLPHCSCTDIGIAVGMTKGAVIGKARRLQLSVKPEPLVEPKMTAVKPKKARDGGNNAARSMRAALRVVELKQIATRVDPVPTSGVTFAQLEPHHCRWPYGEPSKPNFFFCGADRVEGLSYCLEHCQVAYETVAMRRARTKLQEAA